MLSSYSEVCLCLYGKGAKSNDNIIILLLLLLTYMTIVAYYWMRYETVSAHWTVTAYGHHLLKNRAPEILDIRNHILWNNEQNVITQAG